jgi:SAM-dependent methyltransferase
VAEDRATSQSLDWSIGRYETTAERLLPASRVVVDTAAIRPGERVLDLGCGTGNAALLAARYGGAVTGVDPATRLLEVATARAAAEGVDIRFVFGDAAAVPLDDSSIDVLVSVFAVIFAPDPLTAAAEMSRVVTEHGRIVLSAWIPEGPMHEFTSAAADAVRQAIGAPPPPAGFAWHDQDELAELMSPYGFSVGVQAHELHFVESSAAAYLEREATEHPMAIAGLSLLDRLGQGGAVRGRLLSILERGSEDVSQFRMTGRYIVATLSRPGRDST